MANEPVHGREPPAATKPKAARKEWMTMKESIAAFPERYPNTEWMSEAEMAQNRRDDKARMETREQIQKLKSEGMSEAEATEKEREDRVKKEARKH